MKINFIINEENLDSSTDANIMSFLFKKIKDKIDIKLVNVKNYKCEKASINIFFGCINTILNKYAKSNILVPNQHTFLKEWTYALNNFDLILVKTHYMEEIFNTYVPQDKIIYIGWRSTDLYSSVDKDYNEYLLYCYDNNYSNYQKIIDAWDSQYPTLNIINGNLFNFKKKQENIKYLDKLTQNEFEIIFNKCGFHICLNSIDSYSHNINQSCLSKSIPILINGGPMKEIVNIEDSYVLKGKRKKIPNVLGSKYDYNSLDFKTLILKLMKTSENTLEIMSENARKNAIKNHQLNDILFKEVFSKHLKHVRSLPNNIPKELEDYPKVSCVTLTHNRKHLFKLAIYNFNTTNYPKDKLEWIIYDTGLEEEKVEDLLPPIKQRIDLNIKYIYDNSKMTIGEKREKACSLASNPIIVFMDDDDYYFPSSITNRVTTLIQNNKKIVGVRYLASLSINKVISYMNAPSIYSKLNTSVSPASLCFYKDILNDQCKFDHENINECESIFNNVDLTLFEELSWEDIIVSLSHKNNITNRNVPNTKPNGCSYGWSDKLLKFILELED